MLTKCIKLAKGSFIEVLLPLILLPLMTSLQSNLNTIFDDFTIHKNLKHNNVNLYHENIFLN